MLAVAANAAPTPAPASLYRFTNVFSRLAFRYSARDADVAGYRMVSGLLTRSGWRMIQRAVRRRKCLRRYRDLASSPRLWDF